MKITIDVSKHGISILFISIFIIGLFSFQDYGLTWDDEWSRLDTGHLNFNYVFNNDKEPLLKGNEKYHGPFIELVLVCIEKLMGLEDSSDIYTMRHFSLFLLFYLSLILFYLSLQKQFSKVFSIIGTLLLLLSPRIFAESFYNSKDLAFLSFSIITTYSLIQFISKRNLKWLVLHAILTGMLIDIRILGIIVPLFTITSYCFICLYEKDINALKKIIVYILVTCISIVLFWPILWENPIKHFSQAFIEMKKYHWDGEVLFFGKSIHASKLPWYYIPVWIFISTPVLSSLFFILGIGASVVQLGKTKIQQYVLENFLLIFSYFMVLVPLSSVIIFHSVVYDGWRHLYFIYPFMVVIMVYGLNFAYTHLKKYRNLFKFLSYTSLAYFSYIVIWMFIYHPHQNVYFNAISIKLLNAPNKFEKEYWGLSYRQALEFLIEDEDCDLPIKFTSLNLPGKLNLLSLTEYDKKKLKYMEYSDSTWNYYLSNYRGMGVPNDLDTIKEIKVDNFNIIGIYKKRK